MTELLLGLATGTVQLKNVSSAMLITQESDSLEDYLAQRGMYRQRVLGDGECLFRAISRSMFGSEEQYGQLRQLAISTLLNNMDRFRNNFPGDAEFDERIGQLLSTSNDNERWGGSESLYALSLALDVDFQITMRAAPDASEQFTHYTDTMTTNPAMTIQLYLDTGHYDAILPFEAQTHAPISQIQHNVANPPSFTFPRNQESEISFDEVNTQLKFTDDHSYIKIDSDDINFIIDDHAYLKKDSNDTFHSKGLETDHIYVQPNSNKKNECKMCQRTFFKTFNFNRHMKKCHHNQTNGQTKNTTYNKCTIASCKKNFRTVDEMTKHLICDHNVNIIIENHDFNNEEDFNVFKSNEEKSSHVRFIKKTSTNKGGSITYICSRDGYHKVSESRKKSFKKGSAKLNRICHARMHVSRKNNIIKVRYIKSHSHELGLEQIKFLSVPKDVKEDIKVKLALKIPASDILKSFRQVVYDRDQRRDITQTIINNTDLLIVNRKTILNLRKSMTDVTQTEHSDDAESVRMKVCSLQQEQTNPILLYKAQFDKGDILGDSDFILAIMTKEQAEVYTQFGSTILCLDSTHSTNQYKFKLIVLLVVDEDRKGYPVAFCISNTENEEVMTLFLNAVKQRCPSTDINVLMTDDDNTGWKAATSVFGNKISHYLCKWHVDKNWQKKLRELINSEENKDTIYMFLNSMMEASNEEEFYKFFFKFTETFSVTEKRFMDYFVTNYGSPDRYRKWALAFRQTEHAGVNTNNFVESFNNKLKTVYFERIQNKRIDILLNTLLDAENDLFIERVIRHIKNIPNRETLRSNTRHSDSLKIPDTYLLMFSLNQFTVQSSTSEFKHTVKLLKKSCNLQNCYTKCNVLPCNKLCVHMYKCSCRDHSEYKHICKHIHKVHCFDSSGFNVATEEEHVEFHFNEAKPAVKTITYEQFSKAIDESADILKELFKNSKVLQSNGQHVVKQFQHIINKVKGVESVTKKTLPKMKRVEAFGPRAHFLRQNRFSSTSKRVGRKKKFVPKKPTAEEKKKLLE